MMKAILASAAISVAAMTTQAQAVSIDLGGLQLGDEIVSVSGSIDLIGGLIVPAAFTGSGISFGPLEIINAAGDTPFAPSDFSFLYSSPSTATSLSGEGAALATTASTIEIIFDVTGGNLPVPTGKVLLVFEDIDANFDYGADPFGLNGPSTLPFQSVASQITLTALAPIPLPAAMPLLLAALGGLHLARRRRPAA